MNPWLERTGWRKGQEWFKGHAWLRRKSTWMIVSLVVLAAGFAIARQVEHQKRIATEQDLAQTIQAKELVETKLSAEERRTKQLTEVVQIKSRELEQVVARLEEEAHTVERLRGRMAQMESQMGQLQAELVLAMRDREELAQRVPRRRRPQTVELEKITVSVPRTQPLEGKILQVNAEWQFVVVDLGWDLLSVGDVLGVYRDDAFIAKVQVERVQARVAAARVLPEYEPAEIAMDDRVAEL